MRLQSLFGVCLTIIGIGYSTHSAQSYVLKSSRRPNAAYHFEVGLSLSGNTASPSGPTWDSAFAQAAAKWNSASSLVNLSVTQGSGHDPCITDDGIHTAQFSSNNCGDAFGSSVLAVADSSFVGALITDGAIVFNTAKSWNIYTGNLQADTDFRRVAVHELGHLLGLGHENIATSIMAPFISNLEDPQNDDISGISAIYDLGCPIYHSAGAGTISGALGISDCFDTEDGPLPLPNNGAALPHSVGVIADSDALVDLYRVSMPSGGTIEATLTSASFNPVVQILDSTATTELGVEWMPTGSSAVLSQTVAPGNYVVVARGTQAGPIGSYTLTLVPEPSRTALALAAFVTVLLLRMLRMRHHAAAHATRVPDKVSRSEAEWHGSGSATGEFGSA